MTEANSGLLTIFADSPTGRETYLKLDAEGRAISFSGHVDLGTGIETALAQIVADELDLSMDAVRVVLGDTAVGPNQGPTIASETIQISAIPLRLAAAQARRWLIAEAARRLNAPVGALITRNGGVHWLERSCSYGDLVAGATVDLPIDRTGVTKDPTDYRIVGTKVARRDLPAKVTGSHLYVHDIRVDNLLHGHVIRPPYVGRDSGSFVGSSLLSYDEDAIRGMPGFVAVVRQGDFLGIVAERPDQAQAIAKAMPVDWRTPPPLPDLDLDSLGESIRSQPATARCVDATGDFDRGMAEAQTTLRRTYIWPYHEHGSIGPSCAIADWNDGAPIIWCGTQNPHMLRDDLANLVGLPATTIDIRRYQAAGCYGRNCADDVCGDALLMTRALERPVRVQLTRAQEHLWEPKGAAQVMDVEGGLKDLFLNAYALDTWYPSNHGPNLALLLTGRISPEPQPSNMGDRTIVPPYRVSNKRITVHDMAPIVRAAWMRGVSALPNTFAHESFIDEMAAQADQDPVIFRLKHLDDPRTADLVRRTAEAAGWSERGAPRLRREGRMAFGQGFAVASYVHGTFPGTAAASTAWVADVAVNLDTGEVTLTRVFVGQDQGLVINPDGVRQQIHGNVIQTASRVLTEAVTFDAIGPTPQSWAAYPIQTFPAVPMIETMLVERPGDPPLGVGESAAVPAAAAIANAIFDATGVRLCEVPFTPERVRAAMGINHAGPGTALAVAGSFRGPARRAGLWMGAIGAALTVGAFALPLNRSIPPAQAPAAETFSQATIDLGREVFALGDCAVCHTARGGAPNAGARAIPTPFGTVWSTNLTPDLETGLGQWSFEAFDRAMRQGISRDGSHLYPAFPYTAFARINGQDMYALYAFLQTLEPVRQEIPRAQMIAPANIRTGMLMWNWLYHDTTPLKHDPSQAEDWNRGRYLVEAAGHCSGCHAPRNLLGAEEQQMTGTIVEGWFAPALEGPDADARGWTVDTMYGYLRTGHSPTATAAGPMAEVVDSMRAVPDDDVRAIAVYLNSQIKTDPIALPISESVLLPSRASRMFESACAACHTPALTNMLTAAQSPLTKSAALRAPTSETLVRLLDEGIEAPLELDLRDMPSFRDELGEDDRAALIAYLRARFAPDLPPW